MTAELRKFRPRGAGRATEALRVVTELPLGLSDATRDELATVLNRYEPDPTWTYTMLSREQQRLVLKLINASPKPSITGRVWLALVSYLETNTGEIMASLARIAEDAETTKPEASRSMTYLAEKGALIRLRAGRYKINPHVGWVGSLAKRETAAQGVPALRLVQP